MTKKNEYIISPITTYNEWENLYETKIGTIEKGMPLHYIACGKTEEMSIGRAKILLILLNGYDKYFNDLNKFDVAAKDIKSLK